MKTITDEKFRIYENALHAMESMNGINYILEKITLNVDPEYILGGIGDVWTLIEVKLPADGGVFSYYLEHKFAKRGFPIEKRVEKINVIKRVLKTVLYSLIKSKVILAITLLFFRKNLKSAYTELLANLYEIIKFDLLIPIRYSKSVSELYMCFDEEDKTLAVILSMILEYDDAYRYRFQDVLGDLDKTNLARNPYKELKRLLDLAEYRDNDYRLKSMFKKLKTALFLVSFSKEYREKIITFFSRINPENVKMQEDDMYFANLKTGSWGYRYGDSPVS